MRIGIDARFYGSVGKGLGRYTERLIHHLHDVAPPEDAFTIFLRRENWAHFTPPDRRFTKQLADYHWYSVAEQRHMPALVRSAGVELMHYPHFNVPLRAPTPFVVTIHDLILTHFPTRRATTRGVLAYWLKHLAYKVTLSRAVARASHILTVSQFTARDIQQYFGYDPKKITVTYEAVDAFPSHANDVQLLGQFGLPPRYLLYVGNAYPHKNLELFIRALQQLPTLVQDVHLVIVGKADYFLTRLQREFQQAGLAHRVHFTGYVDDATLGTLYRNATAYVFPSLYEGFGLPPLEAMASGTPVLSSNAACMPEVLGEAALYFDPHSVTSFLDALVRLTSTPGERERLVRAGEERVRAYSWKHLAAATLQVYHANARNTV